MIGVFVAFRSVFLWHFDRCFCGDGKILRFFFVIFFGGEKKMYIWNE